MAVPTVGGGEHEVDVIRRAIQAVGNLPASAASRRGRDRTNMLKPPAHPADRPCGDLGGADTTFGSRRFQGDFEGCVRTP